MAAELISIWGRGFLSMTDEEFASAREEGYTGPQQTLLLMEIGDESNVVDVNGLDPQIARCSSSHGFAIVLPWSSQSLTLPSFGVHSRGLKRFLFSSRSNAFHFCNFFLVAVLGRRKGCNSSAM